MPHPSSFLILFFCNLITDAGQRVEFYDFLQVNPNSEDQKKVGEGRIEHGQRTEEAGLPFIDFLEVGRCSGDLN